MHEAETNHKLRRVSKDQPRQLSIIFLTRSLHALRRRRVLLLVLDKVVVVRRDVCFARALETECVLAVGDYADDCCVELAGGHFIDHCLQVRPVAGDEDCDADWGGHCGRVCWVVALDRRFVGFAVDLVEVGGPAVARTERRFINWNFFCGRVRVN